MKTLSQKFNVLQFKELQSFFENRLAQMIAGVDILHVEKYKDCSFDEMKSMMIGYLYDETNQCIGEGANTLQTNFIFNSDTQNDFIRAFDEAKNAVWTEYLWRKLGGSLVNYGSMPVMIENEQQMQELFDVLKVTPYNEISPKDIPDAMKKLCLSSANKVKRIFGFVFNGFNGLVCFDGDYVC